MTYNDGVGQASDGTTRHGSHTFGPGAMGIDHNNYNPTANLRHLLGQDGHAGNAANTANGIQIYNATLGDEKSFSSSDSGQLPVVVGILIPRLQ